MLNAFKVSISIILLILSVAIYPSVRFADKYDDRGEFYARSAVYEFVDSVTFKGFITPEDYRKFQSKLAATGNGYSITIEHNKKILNPVYTGTTFANRFSVEYEGFFTNDVLDKLYPRGSTLSEVDDKRFYKMFEGDMLTLRIKQNTESFSTGLRGILGFKRAIPIPIEYGGAVRHEAP